MSNVYYDLDINFKSYDQILSQMFDVPIVIHKMTLVSRSNFYPRGLDQTMTSVSRSNCYSRGQNQTMTSLLRSNRYPRGQDQLDFSVTFKDQTMTALQLRKTATHEIKIKL